MPAGTVLLSTTGNFSVPGVSGEDEDVLGFVPTSLGNNTTGTFLMLLDLSTLGIAADADLNAVEWAPGPPPPLTLDSSPTESPTDAPLDN